MQLLCRELTTSKGAASLQLHIVALWSGEQKGALRHENFHNISATQSSVVLPKSRLVVAYSNP